jgi:hypothetical protein
MANIQKWLLVGVALIASGCATMPKGSIENSRLYDAPYDKVWEVALEAVADKGGVVTSAHKENGLISVQTEVDYSDRWRYIHFNLGLVKGVFNVNILVVKKDENSCLVTVNSKVFGSTSTGRLEKEYLDKIEYKLKGR